MGVFVKICGIANAADCAAVAAVGPDAMGFVLWPGSKRAVTAQAIAPWVRDLPAGILKVGVFVDAAPDDVRRAMDTGGLDVAQLHGAESAAAFRGFPRRVWRAVALRGSDEPVPVGWSVDAFLVDTYHAGASGGTGRVGDWAAAASFVRRSPARVLLAGGLTPSNVRAAMEAVAPWGVDVSTGVESAPGRKDAARVRAFVEACREN